MAKAKRGRPKLPRGEKKGKTIIVRVSSAERHACDAAAKKADLKLATWARDALLRAAGFS